MSVRIDYGGVAIGAKGDFVPNITDKEDFVDLSELQQDGLSFTNFGNPCDLYSVALDGSVSAFPSNTDSENLGWWSEQLSREDGTFETPIVATFISTGLYISSGITLTFDSFNNVYPVSLNIKWYQDEKLISDVDFQPDNPSYFCSNKVEYYNKIIITFNALNLPYNRLKLYSIEYGLRVTFYGDELKNVKVIQEIDPLSTQISINTCDFILDSKKNIQYFFESRQPITVYFNDKILTTSFIRSSKRKSESVWEVQTDDYIGLLENIPYFGGVYVEKNAIELLNDIFNTAKVPFQIDDSFINETVTGYIPYTNCREALMQVAFSIGAAIDTSNSDKINVYMLSDEVSQVVPLKRIRQGQNFNDEAKMTAIEVTAHSYKAINETFTIYESAQSGTGENIFVKFVEPAHDLAITNGTILSSGTNYAVVNASENCILTGKKYEHATIVKRTQNPLALSTDIENIISVQDATLVSPQNVDNISQRCYNYYKNNSLINLAIVESKHEIKKAKSKYGKARYGQFVYGNGENENTIVYDEPTKVGQLIGCETKFSDIIEGRVVKQTFNLNGNILVKDTEMRT